MIRKMSALLLAFALALPSMATTEGSAKTYMLTFKQMYTIVNRDSVPYRLTLDFTAARKEAMGYSSFISAKVTPSAGITYRQDEKNNRTAHYQGIVKPLQMLTITQTTTVAAEQTAYKLDPKVAGAKLKRPEELKLYLQPTRDIQSADPLIKSAAAAIRWQLPASRRNSPYYITEAVYAYVQTHMHYNAADAEYRNRGALQALQTKVGVCEDYAELMTALLRASGIPSRTVSGYQIDEKTAAAGRFDPAKAAHMWVEVYFNGYGWVPFNPTYTGSETQNYTFTGDKGKRVTLKVYQPLEKPAAFGEIEVLLYKSGYDTSADAYAYTYTGSGSGARKLTVTEWTEGLVKKRR